MNFPISKQPAWEHPLFSDRALKRKANRALKQLKRLPDPLRLEARTVEEYNIRSQSRAFPTRVGHLKKLAENDPDSVILLGYTPIVSFKDFLNIITEDLPPADFDESILNGLTSFDDLRKYHYAHTFDTSTFMDETKPFRRLTEAGEYKYNPEAFLRLIAKRLAELHPLESLIYALSDPLLDSVVRSASIAKLKNFESYIYPELSPSDKAPAGIILLTKPARRFSDNTLGYQLLKHSLVGVGEHEPSYPFVTLDASILPPELNSKLGGAFVPTNDPASASKLLLLSAVNQFDREQFDPRGNSYTLNDVESATLALKTLEALN